jgi:hypothetical protein
MGMILDGAPLLGLYTGASDLRLQVRGPQLVAQVSDCWHDLSTLLLACQEQYHCQAFCWRRDVLQKILHLPLPVLATLLRGKNYLEVVSLFSVLVVVFVSCGFVFVMDITTSWLLS